MKQLSTLDAELGLYYNPPAVPVGKGAGRTGRGAGRRVAGKAPIGDEAGREPTC